MTIIPTVIEQHAVEVAILWLRRDHAVGEPHYDLADLAKLDGRVEAHIDGLRIAGDEGWKLCQEELGWEEAGEVFAAGVLALQGRQDERIEQVFEVGCTAPELERGLISALAWTASSHVPDQLTQLMGSPEPARRRVGIAAFAVRRQDPGASLAQLLADDDPRVRARALCAAGELGRHDLLANVGQATNDQDDACQFWAVWAAARLADRSESVVNVLSHFVAHPGPFQERAMAMNVRTLELGTAKSWLAQLWQHPRLLRPAAIGVGALGDPELVDGLLQLMQVDDLAQVAGEAFSMITGVDLAYDDLEQDMPEGFESGPTEDRADENVALDPDENLPWPNPELVAGWWHANRGNFQPGHRYLCGREISAESLGKTLRKGTQRQRAAAALELGLLQPQHPLFEVRARADWQQAWLKS